MKRAFLSRLEKLEKSLLKPSSGSGVIFFEEEGDKWRARYISMSPTEKWTKKRGGSFFLPVKDKEDDEEECEATTRYRCELTDSFLASQPELRDYLISCDFL